MLEHMHGDVLGAVGHGGNPQVGPMRHECRHKRAIVAVRRQPERCGVLRQGWNQRVGKAAVRVDVHEQPLNTHAGKCPPHELAQRAGPRGLRLAGFPSDVETVALDTDVGVRRPPLLCARRYLMKLAG
jgi:hypothetical protein